MWASTVTQEVAILSQWQRQQVTELSHEALQGRKEAGAAIAQEGGWQKLWGEGFRGSQIQPLSYIAATSVPWFRGTDTLTVTSSLGHSPHGQKSGALGGARARASRRSLYLT